MRLHVDSDRGLGLSWVICHRNGFAPLAGYVLVCSKSDFILELEADNFRTLEKGARNAQCCMQNCKEVSDLATTLPSQAAPVACLMCGGRGWQASVQSQQLDFLSIRTLSQAAKHQWTVMPTSSITAFAQGDNTSVREKLCVQNVSFWFIVRC